MELKIYVPTHDEAYIKSIVKTIIDKFDCRVIIHPYGLGFWKNPKTQKTEYDKVTILEWNTNKRTYRKDVEDICKKIQKDLNQTCVAYTKTKFSQLLNGKQTLEEWQ